MEIFTKIKRHFYIIFLLFIFALLNKFPENYFFSGGDNWQIIDFENHFFKWKNTWSSENVGYPNTLFGHNIFYYPFYLINKYITIRTDFFALFFHFFFNLGTFYSFFYFLKTTNNKLSDFHKVLLSLTYTANIFTFYLFWYSFSYTPFSFNYIFFPLIFSIFWNLINQEKDANDKFKLLLLLPIFTFISSIAYSNIAFLFCVIIILSYITIFKVIFEKKFFFQIFFYFLIFLFIFIFFSSYSFFPGLISGLGLFFNPETTTIFYDNSSWIVNNATSFPDPLFINDSIDIMKTAHPWTYFSIFTLLLIFLSIYYLNKFEINQIIILTIILILILIMNKGVGLLSTENIVEIFGSNILTVFRSSDKASSYLQFFIIFGFILFVDKVSDNKKNILIITFFIFSLISSYPMVLGGVKKYHDVNYNSNKQNYKVSQFANVKKYPEDYIEIKKFFLNLNDDAKDRILILPYSVTSSAGWTDIYTLKHRGVNPALMLFKNSVIEANSPIFKSWIFGEYIQQGEFENWKYNLIKLLQVKYILLHKDVLNYRVNQGIDLMKIMTKKNLFKKLKETQNLILYEINDQESLDEEIYLPRLEFKDVNNFLEFMKVLNEIDIKKKVNSLINFNESENNNINSASAIIASTFSVRDDVYQIKDIKPLEINKNFIINYKKINDAKYILNVSNTNLEDTKLKITLNAAYSNFWVAKCLDCKKTYKFQNKIYNYYSNVFVSEINTNDKNFKIELYFFPEKYVKTLLIIILLSISIALTYYLKLIFYKKK